MFQSIEEELFGRLAFSAYRFNDKYDNSNFSMILTINLNDSDNLYKLTNIYKFCQELFDFFNQKFASSSNNQYGSSLLLKSSNLIQIDTIKIYMVFPSIPRHLVIKNGQLVPHEPEPLHSGQNFNTIPYIHSIRFLYDNQIYETIRTYEIIISKYKNIINNISAKYSFEISNMKIEILNLENIIANQNTQIQYLRNLLTKQTNLYSPKINHNIFAKSSKLQTFAETKNSERLFSTIQISTYQKDQKQICDKLLERIIKSEDILAKMDKLINPQTIKIHQIQKFKDEKTKIYGQTTIKKKVDIQQVEINQFKYLQLNYQTSQQRTPKPNEKMQSKQLNLHSSSNEVINLELQKQMKSNEKLQLANNQTLVKQIEYQCKQFEKIQQF